MDNLLKRWGLVADMEKAFSISFLDEIADCSFRTFLKKFVGVTEKDNVNKVFGTAIHAGLGKINLSLKDGREPCLKCDKPCKLKTDKKTAAVKLNPSECPVQDTMNKTFLDHFDTDVQNKLLEGFTVESKLDEGKELLEKLLRLGPLMMRDAMLLKQPAGDILGVEEFLRGTLNGHKILGVLDFIMGIRGKSIIYDYKTRGTRPTNLSFPVRQLALYVHMLEAKGLPVNGLGAIYLIKADPPKRPKANSMVDYAIPHYFNIDGNRPLYEMILKQLGEDMDMARKLIENGIFMRNKACMFCPCDVSEYCNSDKKIEYFLSCKKAVK